MQVQNRNRALLKKFGVAGMGTGITPEGEAVIKVYTTIPGIMGIPESLEGVRVRTKVTGRFYALRGEICDPLNEPPSDDDCDSTKRWPIPVPIGVSTGHPDITAGTIGARVKDAGGKVYALSNNHVYADINNASIGDRVLQPGPADGGIDPDDEIGTLDDFELINFCSWLWCFVDNQIDAAIAESSTDLLSSATPSDGYGAPETTIVSPQVGQSVMKYGRTTGLTSGTIDAINATVTVGYPDGLTARFVNQIIVASSTAFILPGDSGSLLVTDPGRNPVGLLFAGNQSGTSSIANRIDLVLDRFDVTIDSGAPPVLQAISVTPASFTIGIGETKQFSAIGHYSDGSTSDITSDSDVSWASSVPTVATIDPGGLATGVGEGKANISATYDGITSDPVTLTVTPNDNTYMHVGDLDGVSKKWRWGIWRAIIDITIHDSNEQPVGNAKVVGIFDDCFGGADCEKFECTTNSEGTCRVVGYQSYADHLTFTVESVSHATLEYDPDENHDPDGDSIPPGTSIYVPRP